MTPFLSGLQLSGRLYTEVVSPVIDDHFPRLAHDAALIGWGSEVLGYDDAVSTDHNWGPRLQLFLSPADYERLGAALLARLDEQMPASFYGHPTRYEIGVPAHQRGIKDPALQSEKHQVELHTVPAFFRIYLGVEPQAQLSALDWLLLSEHRLLTVTSGRVFHPGLGALRRAREMFAYYPEQVWRYLLSVQWSRLADEEAFVGRSGDAGDELGSRLIAARQVRLMMRLCFLMERRYAPYSKWLGTAFSRLPCAEQLTPLFEEILRAEVWQVRDRTLAATYETLARMHNECQLTQPVSERTRFYHERPYRVLFAERFAQALMDTVQDEALRALPLHLGSIEQWVDAGVKEAPPFARHVRALYK